MSNFYLSSIITPRNFVNVTCFNADFPRASLIEFVLILARLLEYIKGLVWRALEDVLGIMIGGDINAHIWELDGCENENGRRMKEIMNQCV